MTDNKPWLLVLAAAVAGAVSSGVLLLLEAGAWLARATGQNWHVSSDAYAFWLLAGVPVFLRVVAVGIVAEHSRIATQKAADLEQQRAKTELAWAQVEVTRAALDSAPAADDVITAAPDAAALHRSAMKQALSRFFRGGDQAGSFSIRSLTGIVGDGDWAVLTDFYCSDGGGRVLLNRGGPLGTGWGYGWTLDAVLQALNTDKLPLPPFPEGQVPDVALYVANTAQRNTNTRKSKAGVVVEGVAREVGQ